MRPGPGRIVGAPPPLRGLLKYRRRRRKANFHPRLMKRALKPCPSLPLNFEIECIRWILKRRASSFTPISLPRGSSVVAKKRRRILEKSIENLNFVGIEWKLVIHHLDECICEFWRDEGFTPIFLARKLNLAKKRSGFWKNLSKN